LADALIIIKESPFNTVRCSEALRVGLGLTLTENQVALLFMGDGLHALAQTRPDLIRRPAVEDFFKYCGQLSVPMLADRQGMAERNLTAIRPGVDLISHEEALERIARSRVVVPF
jgi:sulfur relay (sulfurtransferase) DsrF/TusC family protein